MGYIRTEVPRTELTEDQAVEMVKPSYTLWAIKKCATSCFSCWSDTSHRQRRSLRVRKTYLKRGGIASFAVNPLEPRGNYSATSNDMKLVHWLLMGGLLHLVQRGGNWAVLQPAKAPPRCTKCNSPPINCQCTDHRIPYWCIMVRCSAVLMCP